MRRSLTTVRKKCSRYGNSLRGSFGKPRTQTTESTKSEEDQPMPPAEETQNDTANFGESSSKHVSRSESVRSFTKIQNTGSRCVRLLREDKANQTFTRPQAQEPNHSDDEKEMFIITRETLDEMLQAKHDNTTSPGSIPLPEVHPALRQQKKDANHLSQSAFLHRSISGPASIPVSDAPTKQTDSAQPSPDQLGKQALKPSSSVSKHKYSLYPPPGPPPTSILPPLPPQRSPLRHASRYQSHTLPKAVTKDRGKLSNPRPGKPPYTFSKATSKLANAIMQLSGNDIDFNEAMMARADTPDWLTKISKENDAERVSAVLDSPTLRDVPGSSRTGVESGELRDTYFLPATAYALPNSTYALPPMGLIGRRRGVEEEEVPVILETPEST
jgi:hypothetical protein